MIKGIIVEGCDCSGKSTLIRTLKTTLSRSGWDVADLGHKNGNQFDRYMKQYLTADRIIFDRAHFSEAVYSESWRGGCSFNNWELSFLNEYVFENFIVISTQVSPDILKKRYDERSYSQTISCNELERIQDKFCNILNNPKVIKYNASTPKALETLVNNILKKLEKSNLTQEIVKQDSKKMLVKQKDFILIEGANGSGKSTLSKLLKISMVGWGIKTLDYKPISPFERYLKEYSLCKETIFDRGHFSEIVYGNIFRKGNHFSSKELSILNNYVKERGIVIFCNPTNDVLVKRVLNTNYPKHIHESRLEQVQNEFKKALDASGIEYYRIDTSVKADIEKTVNAISSRINLDPYSKMGWDKPLEKIYTL